jgi:hypothetical protein
MQKKLQLVTGKQTAPAPAPGSIPWHRLIAVSVSLHIYNTEGACRSGQGGEQQPSRSTPLRPVRRPSLAS